MRNTHTEIVLTGGPSSGKTTSLAFLQEKLTEWGYLVLLVPEVATAVFSAGVPDVEYLATKDRPTYSGIEREIIYLQMDMRERFRAIGDLFPKQKVVILYDRAEIDARAYLDEDIYQEYVKAQGLTHESLRDSYDAVIHLTSVALAPDAEYDQSQNPQRRENKQMAIDADRRTLNAWLGHHNLHIIDANQDFGSKQRATLAAIAQVLGKKRAKVLGAERRYLLRRGKKVQAPRNARHYTITQDYLRGSLTDKWSVLTKRETGNVTTTYYRGDASPDPLGEDLMVRGRIITRDEYERLLRTDRVQTRKPLVKERVAFRSGNIDFEIDTYASGLVIITAQGMKENTVLPEWVGKEITDNSDYATVNLGLKNK